MGLRLKEQKGPRHAPHSWSQRSGDLTQEPSRLPGLEWVGQTPSSPLPLLLNGPSRLPLQISWPSTYAPRTHVAWRGLWRGVTDLGAQQAPQARVGQVITLRSSPALPRESLPPASPDLPSHRDTNLVWPPLLLPPQSPYVLPVHSGVSPVSLGIRVPHQRPADALAVGRC